jgi:hypothetical protein
MLTIISLLRSVELKIANIWKANWETVLGDNYIPINFRRWRKPSQKGFSIDGPKWGNRDKVVNVTGGSALLFPRNVCKFLGILLDSY